MSYGAAGFCYEKAAKTSQSHRERDVRCRIKDSQLSKKHE